MMICCDEMMFLEKWDFDRDLIEYHQQRISWQSVPSNHVLLLGMKSHKCETIECGCFLYEWAVR